MATDIDMFGEGDKRVIIASFDTVDGAEQAVKKLQGLEKEGLLDIENTAIVTKNTEGGVEFHNVPDGSVRKDVGIGALIGGVVGVIFPPSLLASAAIGGLLGGVAGKMRETGFNPGVLQVVAEGMEPRTSMLISVVEPQWADEVEAALDGLATRMGWAVMDRAAQTAAKLADASGASS